MGSRGNLLIQATCTEPVLCIRHRPQRLGYISELRTMHTARVEFVLQWRDTPDNDLPGGPKDNWNFFYKNCVFILICSNFSHLQSALHLMQYTHRDIFSTAQNSF